MHKSLVKFSKEDRDTLVNAIAAEMFKKEMDKIKAADDSSTGTFRVIISTEDRDRQGEVVSMAGWDFTFYKMNPVVLWCHDYWSQPIGLTTKIGPENIDGKNCLVAEGKFAPTEDGQQLRKLYEGGFLTATSVGFIPKEFDNDTSTITKQELLEYSFVSVPANPFAISLSAAKKMGLKLPLLSRKGITYTLTTDPMINKKKGVVPENASSELAEENAPWKKPTLKDFTDKTWDKLSDEEKTKIATHYAWAKEMPPAAFTDLKLPHHDPKSGKVVWNGVKAAMTALIGGRAGAEVGDDKKAVYAHLAEHYKQFEKEPPELKEVKDDAEENGDESGSADQIGDACSLDDGTPGVFAEDPKNPTGALVCVPEASKSAKDDTEGETEPDGDEPDGDDDPDLGHGDDPYEFDPEHKALVKALVKGMLNEHDRHVKTVRAHTDDLEEAMDESGGKKPEEKAIHINDSIDDFREKMDGEHMKHMKGLRKCVQVYKDGLVKLLSEKNSEGEEDNQKGMESGAKLSKATKEKIAEIHNHVTKAVAVAAEMLANGEGGEHADGSEDGDEPEEGKEPTDGSKGAPKQGSKNRKIADINEFVMGREIVRSLHEATTRALTNYNKRGKENARGQK